MEDFPLPRQEDQPATPAPRRKKQDNGSKKNNQQRKQVLSFLVIVFGL